MDKLTLMVKLIDLTNDHKIFSRDKGQNFYLNP